MYLEDSFPPLWQGVTQQESTFVKPGQVPNLVNMLCDPVTGLRRRPGCQAMSSFDSKGGDADSFYHAYVEVSGQKVVIGVNTKVGSVYLVEADSGAHLASWSDDDYYKAPNRFYIQHAIVGDSLFIANLSQKPAVTRASGTQALNESGFAFVNSGAFGKTYHLNVLFSYDDNTTHQVWTNYQTPDGTGTGDAAKATPEYIAHQLVSQLLGYTVTSGVGAGKKLSDIIHIANEGGYIAFRANASGRTTRILSVTSVTGNTWITTSGSGAVLNAGQLPGVNHWLLNGAVFRVGTGNSAPYFRWDPNRGAWLETAAPNSVSHISNMPREFFHTDQWRQRSATSTWPGKQAGDDTSNPDFSWLTDGISGMFSYQGRLGILSGSKVALSASGKPNTWFRTTVTEVLDSDPIEIATSTQSAATYTQAAQYRKDLLLMSAGHQAYIPGANRVITPRNATVQGIDQYGTTSRVQPQVVGPTLMFCRDLPGGFTGVMEINPATQVEGEYQIFDSTPHLPRYFGGRARFFKASANAPMAVLSTDRARNVLYVYEYAFDGTERMQSAWHRWEFSRDIVDVYWVGSTLWILFLEGTNVYTTRLDPRGDVVPCHLDFWTEGEIKNGWFHMTGASVPPFSNGAYFYSEPSNQMYGSELVGGASAFRDAEGHHCIYGQKFTSRVTLPDCVVSGSDGRPVPLRNSTVLRYDVGLNYAYDVLAYVGPGKWQDRRQDIPVIQRLIKPRNFTNGRLQLGRSWVVPKAYCQLITRKPANDHYVTLEAVSGYRMNITGVSYTMQYTPLYPRRQ